MSKRKPCDACWVEAQRREAAAGEDVEAAYRAAYAVCPDQHDATALPEGAGNPFAYPATQIPPA